MFFLLIYILFYNFRCVFVFSIFSSCDITLFHLANLTVCMLHVLYIVWSVCVSCARFLWFIVRIAYEKGHQRPALTVYTFQSPDVVIAGIETTATAATTVCPNNNQSPATGLEAHKSSNSSISSRPPIPVVCVLVVIALNINYYTVKQFKELRKYKQCYSNVHNCVEVVVIIMQ